MNKNEVVEFAMLKEKVHNIETKLDCHAAEQRQDFDKVLDKLDKLDNKFASKWVEKVIIGVIIALTSTIIGAMLYFT